MTISFADFEKVDIRVGRIARAEAFPEARKPAYKLQIDFGPGIGIKKSSAQLTRYYRAAEWEGVSCSRSSTCRRGRSVRSCRKC
jgi:tRNA-binding protein